MGANFSTHSVTIAESASLSSAADVGEFVITAVSLPSSWDAAPLTFQTSTDGTVWKELYFESGGAPYQTASAEASQHVPVPSDHEFKGVRFVKVRSGTAAAAVVQTAARTVVLYARRIY